MDTINDFFRKYRITEFYEKQKNKFTHPVMPFIPEKHKSLSYGIIPGFRKYDLFYERYLSAVKTFREKGFVHEGIKIMDIGAGEGFFKFFFDALCTEKIAWHGVEVWQERADFCRHIGYTIVDTDLDHHPLPYPDESFDIVIASHVLEHIARPDILLREMNRVLKKGGAMLVATPTKPPLVAGLDRWQHHIRHHKTGETQQAFTHKSLLRMVLSALDYPKESVVEIRGFRLFSSRKRLPLENWKWFHDLNMAFAKNNLFFLPEVNIIVKKPGVCL